jgi:hypothetical protein
MPTRLMQICLKKEGEELYLVVAIFMTEVLLLETMDDGRCVLNNRKEEKEQTEIESVE